MTTKNQQITACMTIEGILSKYPQKSQKLAKTLSDAGLQCVGCQAATWETLEMGMLGHGYQDADIQRLVKRLNAVLEASNSDPTTIIMTERAADKFRAITAADSKHGWALRFADKPGGCGGFEYILDMSEAATLDDVVFHSEGIEIHVHKMMLDRLLGCEIDYADGLMGGGFKVSNPNAKGSCSCGQSQSY